jgi:hypothetical protein
VEAFREDERERQRQCRERRREARSGSSYHAPASGLNRAEIIVEMAAIVDRASRMSRASLTREIAALMRRRASISGKAAAPVTDQPRAADP